LWVKGKFLLPGTASMANISKSSPPTVRVSLAENEFRLVTRPPGLDFLSARYHKYLDVKIL
jgi:hypothetical protein